MVPSAVPSLTALADTLGLVPVPTLLLERPGLRLLLGNGEAAALLGCPPEHLAAAWAAVLGGAEGGALAQRLAGIAGDGRTEVFDAPFVLAGARTRAVLVHAREITLEGRRLLSVGLTDITRQQRAEARLARVQRRLDAALAGAELGAWHRNLRTELIEVSARWCAMLGLPPMHTLPVPAWRKLVHPADRAVLQDHAEAILTGEIDRYELVLRLQHVDGRYIPVLSRGVVIERDPAGRPLVMTGTHHDLTVLHASEAARVESEREARRRLAELETLYHFAPLGLAQFDRSLRFVRINEALAEINGFPVEAHIGRVVWDLVPDLQAAAEPLMRRVLDRGETITGIEFIGETAKAPGVKRDWVEQFYPLRDPETQEVIGLGIVCEEVTERKRAERTRELLLRELDHRVKNLFAVMGGLVAFSAREAASPQAMCEALLGRIEALAQAHDLVRPAIAGAAGDIRSTTLAALVHALLAPFRAAGEQAAGRLRLEGPEIPLGPAAAPPIALALHELATNAAKYGALSRTGGLVLIEWGIEAPSLGLRWSERGGPAVVQPARRGFGHRLVAQSAAQLGGTAEFRWAPEGLTVELRLPLQRLTG
ncbi:hypothetical protein DOO78_13075 [Roseicella frigidaeris]|uniref:histidine kinase n=1 Tax=Roseicella frigidaeris TaxID=2230885 RepID=A0A327M816_9PROT|nr:hypothetical protein DOO78_13075 [Roseicella frigidaeris]